MIPSFTKSTLFSVSIQTRAPHESGFSGLYLSLEAPCISTSLTR